MAQARGVFFLLIVALSIVAPGRPGLAKLHSHGSGGSLPRPFDFGGYVETKYTRYQLNRNSAFYKVEFAALPKRANLDYTSAALRLNGNARAGTVQVRFNTLSRIEQDQVSHDGTNRFDELAMTWKPRPDFSLGAGKIALKWGGSHPWNPVAFAERPKDASDPRLSREGYGLLRANFSLAFSGPLEAVTLAPAVLPVTKHINSDYGKHDYLNVAARLNLDFGATAAALYFLNNGSRAGRYGFDFSHDITSDLDVYAEWARISAHEFRLASPTGASVTRSEPTMSYLAGIRYRTSRRQSFLIELHHNGTGYTAQEFHDVVALADDAVQPGADPALMPRAVRLYEGSFARQKPMRNYAYLRASHDTLPFTPSIRATVNLQDGSYTVTPELLYSDHRRWGLRARLYLHGGGAGTEYGERHYSHCIELRLHYHF